jgi:hypothetical protein
MVSKFIRAAAVAGAAGLPILSACTTVQQPPGPRMLPELPAYTPPAFAVYDHDGELLGADPDPFIRLELRRQGRNWGHEGP